MFEKIKLPEARKSLFVALAAASIGSGDIVLAQEINEEVGSNIRFQQLTENERRQLPLNEALFEYANNFYLVDSGVIGLEIVLEKGFAQDLSGINKTALIDDSGAAIVLNNYERFADGECIVGIKAFNSVDGIKILYSKTPEICSVDALYFEKQELLS